MSSRSTRRSARNRSSQDKAIVAPGFGTAADVERLSRDLGGTLPANAVQAMMQSQGRGIRGKSDSNQSSATAAAPNPPSSAWADFIQEEGVSDVAGISGGNKTADDEPPSKRRRGAGGEDKKEAATGEESDEFEYDLDVLASLEDLKSSPYGSLVQSGTLDARLVGRKKIKATETAIFHLNVPTVLLPSVAITKVCTSCNAAYAIAIDRSNQAYGWGRNEGLVLGSSVGDSTLVPTPQRIASQIQTAALGKSHTIFLKTDGTLHSLGTNKAGQCGWKESTKQSGTLKQCVVLGSDTKFARISCGEDFSAAVSTDGILFTTGSSEFGQLGNGETGEYFVAANKLAFTNGYGFAPQTIYHQTDAGDDSRNEQSRKTVPIKQQILLQDVACGKHHTLALEAPRTGSDADGNTTNIAPRVFSWGCGDYGCLGHARQQPEYFPRHVQFLPKGVKVTKISAGTHCSFVLTAQGHVYSWGLRGRASDALMKPQVNDALANNQHNVIHVKAGSSTVACSTDLGNTVVWGQGPYGELGLGIKKSSAKPTFVESLSGLKVSDMACGQACILYVIKDDDSLPTVDTQAVEEALGS